MEERILQYVDDIDTRRALGLPVRKLPPSDLVIKQGKKWWYMGRPFTEVVITNLRSVIATEDGRIWWCFGMKKYEYSRPFE
jgi:hypothetical protein